jgi:hypothetical protein
MLIATIVLMPIQKDASVPAPTFVPSATRVLVMPSVNVSYENDDGIRRDQIKTSNETLIRLFKAKGFDVINEQKDVSSFFDNVEGLDNEVNLNAAMIFKKAANCPVKPNLILFNAITENFQKESTNPFQIQRESFSSIRTWMLNPETKEIYIDGRRRNGGSTKNFSSLRGKYSRAVEVALDVQFKDFLKGYKNAKR